MRYHYAHVHWQGEGSRPIPFPKEVCDPKMNQWSRMTALHSFTLSSCIHLELQEITFLDCIISDTQNTILN
jgi:hypothetical protein